MTYFHDYRDDKPKLDDYVINNIKSGGLLWYFDLMINLYNNSNNSKNNLR